jgi:hypothetical protein
MDDILATTKKAELDAALATVGRDVGILFGVGLFEAFRVRNWITVEYSSAVGSTLFGDKVPAYDRSHFVFPTWNIPDFEFRIGKNA